MDRSEFSPKQRSHLVRTSTGHWAFVPPPLPPPLRPNWVTVRNLSDAASALSLLAGTARTLRNPRLFIRPFIRREAVLSSRIEGTRTEMSQLVLFEAGGSLQGSGRAVEDVRQVANYGLALDHGVRRLKELPVSLRWIKELHRVLMRGVEGDQRSPGDFRTYQNFIGGPSIAEATYVPPPVPQLRKGLADFERFLHARSDWPSLVRLALIHYQFEALHPFGDGNGRVGRLLLTLLMVNQELLPHPVLYLSAYFERHRKAYYDHLKRVSTEGDWQSWLDFFLEGVREQADDARRRATRLLDLRDNYREQLSVSRVSASALKLVDLFFERIALTLAEAATELGQTRRAASMNVDKLVRAGIVREATGRSRNRIFVADEVLAVVEGWT